MGRFNKGLDSQNGESFVIENSPRSGAVRAYIPPPGTHPRPPSGAIRKCMALLKGRRELRGGM